MAMFSPEEFLRLLRETAELNRDTARLLHDQAEVAHRRTRRNMILSGKSDPGEPPWRPVNPNFRTYAGFREWMLALEYSLLREQKPNKTNICALGSDSVKTVNRAMEHFGLSLKCWPPSSWPEHMPSSGGHALLAVGVLLSVFISLDYLSDGKLNGVINWCHFFGGHLVLRG